jgi:hypothetical protein
VFHQVDISIEVEAKCTRADPAHRGDGVEIPVLAAAHQRHRRAGPAGFGNAELNVDRRNDLEAVGQG